MLTVATKKEDKKQEIVSELKKIQDLEDAGLLQMIVNAKDVDNAKLKSVFDKVLKDMGITDVAEQAKINKKAGELMQKRLEKGGKIDDALIKGTLKVAKKEIKKEMKKEKEEQKKKNAVSEPIVENNSSLKLGSSGG